MLLKIILLLNILGAKVSFNVLYVPDLKINLLSIGQTIEKYIISLYDKDICKMFASKDLDTLLMMGIKDDHVWKMQF